MTDPIQPAVSGGARRATVAFPGIAARVLTPESATPEGLLAAVRVATSTRPVAIAVYLDDSIPYEAAIEEIRRAGVPLVSVGVRPAGTVAAHVEVGWPEGAGLLGERLVEIAEGRRSYVLIHEDGRSERATREYSRFTSPARRQFSVVLLDERRASGDGVRAAVDDMLRTFRHAALVVTLSPSVWLEPRSSPGLPQSCRFATLSAAPALWPWLRGGEAAGLVGPVAGDIGRNAMDLLLKAALNELRGEVIRYVPCELVTAGTLDDFAARYIAAGDLDARTLAPRSK